MFEILLKDLKYKHDQLVQKVPTLEESLKNYEHLAKNYRKDIEETNIQIKTLELLVAFIEEGFLDEAVAQRVSKGLTTDAAPRSVEGVLRDSFSFGK